MAKSRKKMRTLFFAVALSVCSAWAMASDVPEVPYLPDEFTILCVAEKSIGLIWENGDWERANFKENKYLVVKSKENNCEGRVKGSDRYSNWYVTKSVCLNERIMGRPYYPEVGSYFCKEKYWYNSGETKHQGPIGWQTTISCDNPSMELEPNGGFHYAHIHSDFKNPAYKDDYKDSMHVEVGKCSMITP